MHISRNHHYFCYLKNVIPSTTIITKFITNHVDTFFTNGYLIVSDGINKFVIHHDQIKRILVMSNILILN